MIKCLVVEIHDEDGVQTIAKLEDTWDLEEVKTYAREYLRSFIEDGYTEGEGEMPTYELIEKSQPGGKIQIGIENHRGEIDSGIFIEIKEVQVQ